ncbi:MAG: hypothetical protein GC164_12865 [Phycisphaera sp.]|nr:hypothetical protein [Phycisphaera sp.]
MAERADSFWGFHMLKFRCQSCQHKLAVPDTYAGKHVKCPKCSSPIEVPSHQSPTPEATLPTQTEDSNLDNALAQLRAATEPAQSVSSTTSTDPAKDWPAEPAETEPTPPITSSRSAAAHTSRNSASTSVPSYSFLRLFGIVYTVLGVIVVAGSLVVAIITVVAAMGTRNFPTAILMSLGIAVYGVVIATVMLGMGQAIFAFRDIACNSWYTRDVVTLLKNNNRT